MKQSELEQNDGISYKKNWESEVVPVVDLSADLAKKNYFRGHCNTGFHKILAFSQKYKKEPRVDNASIYTRNPYFSPAGDDSVSSPALTPFNIYGCRLCVAPFSLFQPHHNMHPCRKEVIEAMTTTKSRTVICSVGYVPKYTGRLFSIEYPAERCLR